MTKNKKGFTLIELLVVIAIIGLLSTLAMVSLNNARQRSRDARRLSDVRQIQTALELYYTAGIEYPDDAALIATYCGSASALGEISGCCLSAAGWLPGGDAGCASAYMRMIPPDPSDTGNNYTYATSLTGSVRGSYNVTYTLEGATSEIATAGAHSATPAGICDDGGC